MELNPKQTDALTELINIGYGRAASALSELTGYRVSLEVPKVAIEEILEIAPQLEAVVKGEVASVNQMFSGPISGNAMLLLDQDAAVILSRLFDDDRSAARGFDSSAREVVTEIGNILLNACLGVFGNLLHVQVSFAVPRLQVETVKNLLQSVTVNSKDRLTHGLMIQTRFNLRSSDVSGYLVIILGITSLDRLLSELAIWETRQTG
ncbi:chemotaxis protein CheC [Oleiharenicola lentus]|uniref:chemotaxis protein CheC n=1 Tax=Oleiharenicola lentus TaxID=2508720 RepID=UPI003F678B26